VKPRTNPSSSRNATRAWWWPHAPNNLADNGAKVCRSPSLADDSNGVPLSNISGEKIDTSTFCGSKTGALPQDSLSGRLGPHVGQQVLRVDREPQTHCQTSPQKIKAIFIQRDKNRRALAISDYGFGSPHQRCLKSLHRKNFYPSLWTPATNLQPNSRSRLLPQRPTKRNWNQHHTHGES